MAYPAPAEGNCSVPNPFNARQVSHVSLRFTMAGLAVMWLYDLNYYTVEDLGDGHRLEDWRGLLMLLSAPLFAFGAQEDQASRIRLSRSASFQSLAILAICAYFALMVILSTALRGSAHDWVTIDTVAILTLMTLGAMVLIPSAQARGWAKALLARHLFEHRYDYRAEWLRFAATLGHNEAGSPPLNERIIRAFADIVEVPGGLLLTEQGSAMAVSASLEWPSAVPTADKLADSGNFWTTRKASASSNSMHCAAAMHRRRTKQSVRQPGCSTTRLAGPRSRCCTKAGWSASSSSQRPITAARSTSETVL